MDELYITSKELIETLKISEQEFIEIEQFFDSDPNDEWELLEGKDYRIVIQKRKLREYTQSGAYTIARYLESTRKQGFWELISEWILHTKRNIRRRFVKKKILDNCSSLVKRNGRFFVSKADVVSIFGTRPDYLVRMAGNAQKTQFPLIKGQDYDDLVNEGGLHFSVSGIYKLAQVFERYQTKQNRKEWCKDVGEVIDSQVNTIVSKINYRYKNIEKAKSRAKERDHNTCQVTGAKKTHINNLELEAHHLYSRNEYPYLVDIESNLITITDEVHKHFHLEFMGGNDKPCTVDDFIRFLQRHYHTEQVDELIVHLEHAKQTLGDPKPTRKPHVLHLPKSRVT